MKGCSDYEVSDLGIGWSPFSAVENLPIFGKPIRFSITNAISIRYFLKNISVTESMQFLLIIATFYRGRIPIFFSIFFFECHLKLDCLSLIPCWYTFPPTLENCENYFTTVVISATNLLIESFIISDWKSGFSPILDVI